MEIKNIREVLEQLAQFLQDNLKDGVINKGLFKTGKLANSVQVRYQDDDKEPRFSLSMENYGFYQDSGVNGTKSGFTPNPESLFEPGQFKSKVIGGSLPFAARKSIAEKGLNYKDKLIMAGEEDINEEILDLFKLNGATI